MAVMLNDFQAGRSGVLRPVIGFAIIVCLAVIGGCGSSSSYSNPGSTVGPATKLAFTSQPSNAAAGTGAISATVSIEDASGNVVTTATNQVTIAIGTNPGSGALSGTATATATAGVATFSNLTINNAGTGYTLAASASGLTGATSNAFNVVGAAAKLAFTVQPTSVGAGVAITSVAVSVEDSSGNVVPSATNQITIAIGTNPATGTLSGTAQVNAVAGVATFTTLSINNVGTGYTLTASASGLTAATSNPFNVTAGCTTNCAISGAVSGTWVSGVTITLSGGPGSPAPAVTDVNGHYSFTGLTQGTYTITPSLTGYSYTPAAPSVSIGTSTVQNFTAASTGNSSFSISGTITYAGAQTGKTIIRVYPSGCTGCGPIAGTSLPAAPSGTGTAYVVRGLAAVNGGQNGNGSYVVSAEIDTQGTGITNESDPEGNSSTVTITTANITGANLTVADRTPSAPVTPTQVNVAPGNGGAVVEYNEPQDNNGEEIATSYKVYYGTDVNATNGAGSPKSFKAQGQGTDIFVLQGLTNGVTFFKVSAVNSQGESAATTPTSVTLGAGSGGNTVSGNVTFPGSATGHTLYVGVFGNSGIFFQAIPNPSSPQAYSFAGVPSGTYENFAIIDMNDDGEVNPPDLNNVSSHSNPPTISVSGPTTGDITLTNAVSAFEVPTAVQGANAQPNTFNISVQVDSGTKLPISATLFSGKNVAVPYDMNADQHNANYAPIYNFSVSPTVGDTYQFLVTFSDGSTQVVTGTVTGVLTSFAQNLVMQTTAPGSPTIPLLTWSAPATLPTAVPFTYSVNLANATGTAQEFWSFSGNGINNGIPSSQTSVLFNTDSSASPNPSLTVAGTYNWSVTVQDNNNNSAQFTTTYIVP